MPKTDNLTKKGHKKRPPTKERLALLAANREKQIANAHGAGINLRIEQATYARLMSLVPRPKDRRVFVAKAINDALDHLAD